MDSGTPDIPAGGAETIRALLRSGPTSREAYGPGRGERKIAPAGPSTERKRKIFSLQVRLWQDGLRLKWL